MTKKSRITWKVSTFCITLRNKIAQLLIKQSDMKKSILIVATLFIALNTFAQGSEMETSLNSIIKEITKSENIKKGNPTDMGYPHYMVAATQMMGDVYPSASYSYDWFNSYNTMKITEKSYSSLISWYTSYNIIAKCNSLISQYNSLTVDKTDKDIACLGAAYAIRAFCYYTLMVLYEPIPNEYTDCSKVVGLTIPIITEKTTDEELKNNPRASHTDMIKFILSDLDIAENSLKNYQFEDNTIPNVSVVYGIKAKVYLWDKDYNNAATYAGKAIEKAKSTGAYPMSATEWEEPTTGCIKARSSWIWYMKVKATSIYTHLASWLCGEVGDDGYAEVIKPVIDRNLYDLIGEKDFRKSTFLNPQKYSYYNYLTSRDRSFIENAPAYLALKFRHSEKFTGYVENDNGGYWTEMTQYDLPLMRIEEMYYIEAEATGASKGLSLGLEKLNDFVKNYRDPNYNYETSDLRTFQIEVLNQMRIEFWGEGKALSIAKRLRPGVMQYYTGTNAPQSDEYQINCKGIKPVWNMVIPQQAIDENSALEGNNNPIPLDCIKAPSPIDQYSQGKYLDTKINSINYQNDKELYYGIDGKRRNQLQKGINIIRTKDGKVIKKHL